MPIIFFWQISEFCLWFFYFQDQTDGQKSIFCNKSTASSLASWLPGVVQGLCKELPGEKLEVCFFYGKAESIEAANLMSEKAVSTRNFLVLFFLKEVQFSALQEHFLVFCFGLWAGRLAKIPSVVPDFGVWSATLAGVAWRPSWTTAWEGWWLEESHGESQCWASAMYSTSLPSPQR